MELHVLTQAACSYALLPPPIHALLPENHISMTRVSRKLHEVGVFVCLFLPVFQVEKECIRELEAIGSSVEKDGTFFLRAKNTLNIYSNATSFNFRVSCLYVCVCLCVCVCV